MKLKLGLYYQIESSATLNKKHQRNRKAQKAERAPLVKVVFKRKEKAKRNVYQKQNQKESQKCF